MKKAYFLVSPYLSPIQQGIQTAHCVAELMLKYPNDPFVRSWARDHKTIVVLSYGFDRTMADRLLSSLVSYAFPSDLDAFVNEEDFIRYAEFREPELSDHVTCIGFVLTGGQEEDMDLQESIPMEKKKEFIQRFLGPEVQSFPIYAFLRIVSTLKMA